MFTIAIEKSDFSFVERLRWERTVSRWAVEAGPMTVSALKEQAPVGQGSGAGRLRESIRYTSTVTHGGATMQFYADVPYTQYVLGGTVAHDIRPRRGQALKWQDGLGDQFAAVVHHPGTQPNPFPRRALVPLAPHIQRGFRTSVQRALEGR